LDGQANDDYWWNWKQLEADDNAKLKRMAKDGIPAEKRIFGAGFKLRVNFIEPYRCRNVLIEGVTVINSPMWEVEPVECTNVTVRKINVNSHGPNNDGCDPQSCTDVLIKECRFDTGDDCIAVKAGRDDDGRRLNIPCQNVVIQNCQMKDGHGGITIGSETSGSIRYIFAENCILDSPNLSMAIRIKSNSVRGGTVEKIFIRNITVGKVRDAVIHATMYYSSGVPREGDIGNFAPVFQDIYIRNVRSENSNIAVFLEGYARSPIRNVSIEDCNFNNVQEPNYFKDVINVKMIRTFINGKLVK
jgi:polygalacturonase